MCTCHITQLESTLISTEHSKHEANWFNHKRRERNQAVTHLSDLELVEHILQDPVILDHVVLRLGVEVNLVHQHGTRTRRVHQLARNRAKKWINNTDAQASCFEIYVQQF